MLETPSGAAQAVSGVMQAANPIFLSTEESKQGRIYLADTAQLATAQDVRGAGQPAQPGDSLSIRATGLGTDLPVSVKIGGIRAVVQSVGPLAGVGGV